MEPIAFEIRNAMSILESIPGAFMVPDSIAVEPPLYYNNNRHQQQQQQQQRHNPAAHRRALRRLEKALHQLEQHQHQNLCRVEPHAKDSTTMSSQQDTSGGTEMHAMDDDDVFHHHDSSQDDTTTTNMNARMHMQQHLSQDTSGGSALPLQRGGKSIDNMLNVSQTKNALSEQVKDDLQTIISRLAIPTEDIIVGIEMLSVSVLQKASKLWLAHARDKADLLPIPVAMELLHRLLDCQEGTQQQQHNTTSNGDEVDVSWYAIKSWLEVLTTNFMVLDDKRVDDSDFIIPEHHGMDLTGHSPSSPTEMSSFDRVDSNIDDMDAATYDHDKTPLRSNGIISNTLLGSDLVHILSRCLECALETVQMMPWEQTDVGNDATEIRVQWRILTGYLIEHTIRLQLEDDVVLRHNTKRGGNNNNNNNVVEQWLTDRCIEAECYSCPDEISTAVHNLISKLSLYATELTEYALDALDGAAVPFFAITVPSTTDRTTKTTSSSTGGGVPFALWRGRSDPNNEESDAAMAAAEEAVQDSLRHVSLATNVLVAIEPWCSQWYNGSSTAERDDDDPLADLVQVYKTQIGTLWKTLAESFLAKSNVATIFSRRSPMMMSNHNHNAVVSATHESIASRFCHHQLKLADIYLSSSLMLTNGTAVVESTMTLTFLRALDFPEHLLGATRLWDAMEHSVNNNPDDSSSSSTDLKRVLQACVLTLHKQYMLRDRSVSSSHPRQDAAQAVVDRLLGMLQVQQHNNKSHSTTSSSLSKQLVTSAWDGFFLRQLDQSRMERNGDTN